jgi:hypothetical protein
MEGKKRDRPPFFNQVFLQLTIEQELAEPVYGVGSYTLGKLIL